MLDRRREHSARLSVRIRGLPEHAATSKRARSGAAQGALELSLLMNSTEAAAMSL
jgi:hypothetical protein